MTEKIIWKAKDDYFPHEATLERLGGGWFYLVISHGENEDPKHIMFDRDDALRLARAIEDTELKQKKLLEV